jgi:hypothetical protein
MAVLITGRTYPVKDQLRALGGTWDARAKGWRVPDAVAAQAHVTGAPASRPAFDSNGTACEGHPAGPFDAMGETVYCDGSCQPARCQPARSRARYGSRYTRFSSGAEVFTNVRGRCEDAPCCGCCS